MPPVTTYAPALLEFYHKAAQSPVTITLTTKRAAFQLRARLNALRVAMRLESHPLTTIADSVTNSIREKLNVSGANTWLVIGSPCDQQYLGALRTAGITVDPTVNLSELTLPELEGPPVVDPEQKGLDELFSSTGSKKETNND